MTTLPKGERKEREMTQLQTEVGMVRVPAGTWRVDPNHSSVAFEVKHMMIATVRGRFSDFDGELEAAEDDPTKSRARGTVKVASIDTGNPDRDAHLRSPEFFDADRYPEMRFESTSVRHVHNGHYLVVGDLTIKDHTKEVEVDAMVEGAGEDPWGNERVGISIRGVINRTEFGLTWQQKAPTGALLVGEEVTILIDVSAIRA
jgi:polyisoprenoid-binding protein YceI